MLLDGKGQKLYDSTKGRGEIININTMNNFEGRREAVDDCEQPERTAEQIEIMKEQIRNATTMDLSRYFLDVDYQLNISENPLVSKFEDDVIARTVWEIVSQAREIGLTVEQVELILEIFDPDVRSAVIKTLQGERVARDVLHADDSAPTSEHIN